jgi:hypothetical protein
MAAVDAAGAAAPRWQVHGAGRPDRTDSRSPARQFGTALSGH